MRKSGSKQCTRSHTLTWVLLICGDSGGGQSGIRLKPPQCPVSQHNLLFYTPRSAPSWSQYAWLPCVTSLYFSSLGIYWWWSRIACYPRVSWPCVLHTAISIPLVWVLPGPTFSHRSSEKEGAPAATCVDFQHHGFNFPYAFPKPISAPPRSAHRGQNCRTASKGGMNVAK